jgi:L-ascorbate metabolism protein UlaG (beta-lactamase superfamily)
MTGAYDHLGANGVDLAIMGIGAYDPWVRAHATPEQVWQMSAAMRARRVLPVHFGTFKLSDEPPDEPMARLLAAAGSDHPRILGPALGHVHQLPG